MFCLNKTHFCNLCGKQLTNKGHQGHFLLKGPYGDTCNTLDKIDEPSDVGLVGTEMPHRVKEALRKRAKARGDSDPVDDDEENKEGK
jgi:hypothetical protein